MNRSSPQGEKLRRILRFGAVGLSGVVVNQGILMLLHGSLGFALMISSALAIEVSILSNFVLNNSWTWRYDHARSLRSWLRKAAQYHLAVGLSALVGNIAILMTLVQGFGVDYRIANLFGIVAAALLNFLAGEHWVFRRSAENESRLEAPGAVSDDPLHSSSDR